MAKQVAMVKPIPVQPVVVQTSALQVESRERKAGVGLKCPKCGSTHTFVTQTRAHPEFIEKRLRHYKCGQCSETFKS